MSDALVGMKCEACSGDTPVLSDAQAAEYAVDLDPEWVIDGDGEKLFRQWKTKNFNSAFSLATAMALLAEKEGHHPDLEIGWGRVTCSLTTHAIGGLSLNDFIMAAKIDRLG